MTNQPCRSDCPAGDCAGCAFPPRAKPLARSPNRGSLRDKIVAFWAANPKVLMTRHDIMERFRVSDRRVETALYTLKRSGTVRVLVGPDRVTSYQLVKLPTMVKPPRPRVAKPPARKWPSESQWEPPKPIPNSVWALARLAEASA